MGWGVINMTAYPEGWLARELGLCYANVSLITDYDVGLEDDASIEPVSHEAVVEVFTAEQRPAAQAAVRVDPQNRRTARRCLQKRAVRGAVLSIPRGGRGPSPSSGTAVTIAPLFS